MPRARVQDSDILVISPQVLTAFERGLRKEIALREDLRRQLAARQTREQYDQCTRQAATSPENLKVAEAMFDTPANAKPEEVRPRMMRFGKLSQALILKKCGPEPNASDGLTRERLEDIEAKAAAAAGPIP